MGKVADAQACVPPKKPERHEEGDIKGCTGKVGKELVSTEGPRGGKRKQGPSVQWARLAGNWQGSQRETDGGMKPRGAREHWFP